MHGGLEAPCATRRPLRWRGRRAAAGPGQSRPGDLPSRPRLPGKPSLRAAGRPTRLRRRRAAPGRAGPERRAAGGQAGLVRAADGRRAAGRRARAGRRAAGRRGRRLPHRHGRPCAPRAGRGALARRTLPARAYWPGSLGLVAPARRAQHAAAPPRCWGPASGPRTGRVGPATRTMRAWAAMLRVCGAAAIPAGPSLTRHAGGDGKPLLAQGVASARAHATCGAAC